MLRMLILYMSGVGPSFKVNSEWQVFDKHLPWELLRQICWEEVTEEFFWCLTCGLNRGLKFNKPIHYLLDYADEMKIVMK